MLVNRLRNVERQDGKEEIAYAGMDPMVFAS